MIREVLRRFVGSGSSAGRSLTTGEFWVRSSSALVGSISFLLAMEWLFQVTRPSFLLNLSWWDRILVLFGSLWVPMILALAVVSVLTLVSLPFGAPRWRPLLMRVVFLIAGCVVAIAFLQLLGNFTATTLGTPLEALQRWGRLALTLAFLASIVLAYSEVNWAVCRWNPGILLISVGFVAFMSTLAVLFVRQSILVALPDSERNGVVQALPNILLIGADGLPAERMSLFGYNRTTTPHLDQLADEALLSGRAFTNASGTAAATVSILTGRLPTETGFFHSTDRLSSRNAHLHLPAILRKLGYRQAQFSTRSWADAFDFNLLDSFDEVNGRRENAGVATIRLVAGDDIHFFSLLTLERHGALVRHLFSPPSRFLGQFVRATSPRLFDPGFGIGDRFDEENVTMLFEFIESSQRPFFAHLFLLGSHGPRFAIREPLFSRNQKQVDDWMDNFFDDAIREVDGRVGRIIDFLGERDLLDQTVVVFYSDHGPRWDQATPLPFLIRFPNGALAGHIGVNVQNIDIAPTLLDYLDVVQPRWLTGDSLIGGSLDPCREIIGFRTNDSFYEVSGGRGGNACRASEASLIHGEERFRYFPATGELRKDAFAFARLGSCDRLPEELVRERLVETSGRICDFSDAVQ